MTKLPYNLLRLLRPRQWVKNFAVSFDRDDFTDNLAWINFSIRFKIIVTFRNQIVRSFINNPVGKKSLIIKNQD